MKTITTTILFSLITLLLFAFSASELSAQTEKQIKIQEHHHDVIQPIQKQTPQAMQTGNGMIPGGFSFQAVARDANGNILSSQDLGIRVRILKGSASGEVVYTETHTATSTESGLLHLVIGEGSSEGSFSSIDWTSDNYYVDLAADPDGGTNYEALGTTRLLSVPYAMVAKNVLEGLSADELAITQYNLNTAEGDTSFIINSAGPGDLTTLRVNSGTDGFNIGVSGNAMSEASNPSTQRGIQGIASGAGTGNHTGVFGSAVNSNATGGNRYGLWGQAVSQARYNYGTIGIAQGAGDGTIVQIGDDGGDDAFGSFNIGGGFYAQGNINGNLGVEGVVSGSAGQRINIGVEGRVTATAAVPNFGLNGRAFSSPVENIGVTGHAEGPEGSFNVGVRGTTGGSGDNLAGLFYGTVEVQGDINHAGSINQISDRNLKENVRPIENALSSVMSLNPTVYSFRGNGLYKGMNLPTRPQFGLIAQEVEEVLPALVQINRHRYSDETDSAAGPAIHEGKKLDKIMEYKTVNYTELIPVLIKAMQEQQEEIELLRRQVEELKKR